MLSMLYVVLYYSKIFIKLSIQQILQALKIIIGYKNLLVFDRVFSEIFGRNFNPPVFRYRSWFEAFYWLIGDSGGAALKV